jgi:hypothetical protein
LVKKVKSTQWGLEVEFYDAQAALGLLGKHLNLFIERVDMHHSGEVRFTAEEAARADKELQEWLVVQEQNGWNNRLLPDNQDIVDSTNA